MEINLENWEIQKLLYAIDDKILILQNDLKGLSRDDCYDMNARDRKSIYDYQQIYKKLSGEK